MPSPELEHELRLVEAQRAEQGKPRSRLMRLAVPEIEAALAAEVGSWTQRCPACSEVYPDDAQFIDFGGVAICGHCAKPRLQAEQEERRKARLSGDRARALEEQAGVPRRFLRPFVEPAEWPAARSGERLSEWTGSPWAAVIVGPVGSGKTFFGVELLWRALLAGKTAAFVRAAEIPGLSIREAMPNPDVLLVDDLGLGHTGGGWEVVSRELLGRYDGERATVFTTRLRLTGRKLANGTHEPGIADHDTSLGDRLRDGLAFAVQGPSRRG